MATKKTRKRSTKPKAKAEEPLMEVAEPEPVEGPVTPVFGSEELAVVPLPFEPKPVPVPADGTLIRMDGEAIVYVMHEGQRRPFGSPEAFVACGFGWGDIIVKPPEEIDPIPVGPKVIRQGDL